MKIGKRLLALVLAITLAMSCGVSSVLATGSGNGQTDSNDSGALKITGFAYSPASVKVNESIDKAAGMEVQYQDSGSAPWVKVTPDTLAYESGDPLIATVDENGKVTGVAAGNVTITAEATYKGKNVKATASVTVTAKTDTTYKVKFLADGGTPVPEDQTINKGGKATEPKAMTKQGYTFKEWQHNGSAWNFANPVNSDMELKAIWTMNTVDKQALKDAISKDDNIAGKIALSTTDGDDVFDTVKWTTPAKYATYQAALKEAKAVDANTAAKQTEVDAATKKLMDAYLAMDMNPVNGKREKYSSSPWGNYPNNLSYISIDTTEAGKLSDYMEIRTTRGITGARVMYDPANADSAELYGALTAKLDSSNAYESHVRLQLNSGKPLSKSIYLVPVMIQLENGYGAQIDVELHVNATDPAYIKTSEAVFTVADLNKPGKELTSTNIVVKSPSGEEIKSVKVPNNNSNFAVVGGKWDAAKKEYTFQLKATADKDGEFELKEAEVLVSFAGKARMAFHPATVPVAVATSDDKLKEYVNIRPYALYIDNESGWSIGAHPTEAAKKAKISLYGDVVKITNFKSQPANAITIEEHSWGYAAYASAKGTATFDAVADIKFYANDEIPFKVDAEDFIWTTTNAKFTAPLTAENDPYSYIDARSPIDINDLSTYAVKVEANFCDDKGASLEIEKLTLKDIDDGHLFQITKEPVKQPDGSYQFEVTLQNDAKTIDTGYFWLAFDVTIGGKQSQEDVRIELTTKTGGPKDIYLTKNGKKITSDVLTVDAVGTKYGIVVEDYKMVAGDELKLSSSEYFTIVRGKNFYGDMNTSEVITIRMEKAVPDNMRASVEPKLTYKKYLKVTNPAVKLKLVEGVSVMDDFRGTRLELTSKSVPTDKTALKAAINAATAAKKGIYISVNGSNVSKTSKWVTQAAMTAFENAITKAQTVLNNAAATADEIIVATDMMKKATADFVKAQKYGTKSSGGSSGGGGGSSGGGSTPTPAPTQPTSKEVNSDGSVNAADTAKEATNAIKNALATNNKNASVVIENAKTISSAALKEIANAAKAAGGNVKLNFDTTVDGKTVARIAIDPAKAVALGKTINLTVAVDAATTAPVVNHFSKYFANDVAVASFAQAGEFGMTVDVAVRVDLTNIDLNKLQVYSYDRKTNKYVKVNPGKVYVDKNGFLHFQTNRGGDLLFSNGPLTAK